jgi:steroid delta-isomerase-like uncharacterized protein
MFATMRNSMASDRAEEVAVAIVDAASADAPPLRVPVGGMARRLYEARRDMDDETLASNLMALFEASVEEDDPTPRAVRPDDEEEEPSGARRDAARTSPEDANGTRAGRTKAAELRYWSEVMNEHRLDAIDALLAEDVVDHGALPGQGPGRDGVRDALAQFFRGSPDVRYDIDDLIAADDRVVTRWSAVGTHAGEIFGAAPTGRRVTGTGISINRYEDGRIVEMWMEFDSDALMRQLRAAPDEGPSGT